MTDHLQFQCTEVQLSYSGCYTNPEGVSFNQCGWEAHLGQGLFNHHRLTGSKFQHLLKHYTRSCPYSQYPIPQGCKQAQMSILTTVELDKSLFLTLIPLGAPRHQIKKALLDISQCDMLTNMKSPPPPKATREAVEKRAASVEDLQRSAKPPRESEQYQA